MRRQGFPPPDTAPAAFKGYPEDGGPGGKGWARPDPYLLQQYRTKYGTLSTGSALCKSMKYAEPWLYGSVAARRPLVYPVMVLCSCPEFLAGTQRSKKSPPSSCKKCGGSRSAWGTPGPPGGTVRLGAAPLRPSLFGVVAQESPPPPPPATPDPYDLMRRNRLGSVTPTEPPTRMSAYEPCRARAKSSSPSRRKGRRDPSPPTTTTTTTPVARVSRRDAAWRESSPDAAKRKSILECDVNAYELIAKYLRNGGGRSQEEMMDDELSDNLSDNALEDLPATNRPRKAGVNGNLSRRAGITIGGQTIRLFSDAGKDVDDGTEDFPPARRASAPVPGDNHASKSPSMIPRLTSPRRPPRRLKASHNQTPSTAAAASAPEASAIKSILKKRAAARTFGDTVSKPDPAAAGQGSPSPSFHLPTFQEYRQQNRKKKQVQFKVGDEPEQLQVVAAVGVQATCVDVCEREEVVVVRGRLRGGAASSDCDKPQEVVVEPAAPTCDYDGPPAGGSEGDLVAASLRESATYVSQYGVDRLRSESNDAVTLRRSLSERLSTTPHASLHLAGSRRSVLFHDTMRLRFQPAQRPDARHIFDTQPSNKPVAVRRHQRLLSPVRSRPREPPPPPPPPPSRLPEPPPRLGSKKHAPVPVDDPPPKPRPNSWSPPHLASHDTGDALSVFVKEHRLSDPGPPPSTLRLQVATPETFIAERPDEEIRTVVSVASPPQQHDVHRLEVRNDNVVAAGPHHQGCTSIVINGDDSSNLGRTSVVIGDDGGGMVNVNRVTISVGGSPCMQRSSSCTVIDTCGKVSCVPVDVDDYSSFNVPSSATTVIPISSPKKTLVILDHCSTVEVTGVEAEDVSGCAPLECSPDTSLEQVDVPSCETTKDEVPPPLSYTASSTSRRAVDDAKSHLDDKDAMMDPVEAVKRNLVPHVCGKSDGKCSPEQEPPPDADDDNISLLSEKLKEDFYLVTPAISRCFDSRPSKDHIEVPEALMETTEDEEEEEDLTDDEDYELCSTQSTIAADDRHDPAMNFDDDGSSSVKDDADDSFTARLPLSRPRFVVEEKDAQDEDDEDEEENMYESIKDHIYEEIADTPPPLPLSPPPALLDDGGKRSSRSIFEGASKYDILSYLEGAKERGIVPEDCYYSGGSTNGDEPLGLSDLGVDDKSLGHGSLDLGDLSSRVSHLSNNSDSSEDSCNLIITSTDDETCPEKVRKSSAEIERNDSGVGSETSKSSRSRWQHGPALSIREDQLQHLCEDCDQPVETQVTDSGVMFAPLVCRKCGKKRAERKDTIAEIVETEEKYGRDLRIMLDEFYRPMLVAGLLTADQLQAIFLNAEELLDHNTQLAEKLRDALEIALEHGDEDLLTVNIGRLFLDAAPMLHAFESYCTRQAAASLLLANLEKEKELLRIFLKVSQMENTVLRRMNLNSFLMVPVQRVTKYPLLLARLYKVTPPHHEGRELLKEAQHKIELHLEHMNEEAKDFTSTKLWRRISIMNSRRSSGETDMVNIKLRKMALDVLEWNHDEARFVMEGKLLYTNPTDNNWRRGRTIKLNPINAMLITNGKPAEEHKPDPGDEALLFPRKTGVREATLLLLKEKGGRYTLIREPLYLDKCIVCCEADWEDYFEVQELASKDTFIFKAEDGERTKAWFRQLQYHAQGLGAWRKRRNALANIMINGMLTRN